MQIISILKTYKIEKNIFRKYRGSDGTCKTSKCGFTKWKVSWKAVKEYKDEMAKLKIEVGEYAKKIG